MHHDGHCHKEKLVGTNEAGDAYVTSFSSGVVQVKSVTHCCAAGAYATSDIVQRSGCMFPPSMWIPLSKTVLMKAMPNVDVIFGNVTEAATFVGTGSPTAGESAIFSPTPSLRGFREF